MSANVLDHFHPLIAGWFAERIGPPTKVQLCAWDEVRLGRHVLVTAATGSGKTLAAFLWAINQLVTGAWPHGGTRVVYVSPLKALNNDVRRNLIAPLADLRDFFAGNGAEFPAIGVQTRSGDTLADERRRLLRHPPEILITTPESLNIMLASKGGRAALTGVATVILDEIHAVAGGKRGVHLITAVERLVLLSGEFQRIALSATVRPLETVARFVGGLRPCGGLLEERPVAIVRGDRSKRFVLLVSAPAETDAAPGEELWAALTRRFVRIIDAHSSTLFFANSRRTTERVTRLINEEAGEELAFAHHGSLSREIRLAVEERLKRGELRAIVATNSLELGLDIGRLESVVLIQTPRSISSAIQRIGRSGHGPGEVSSGLLFPTHGMDFVAAAVIARAVADGEIEELRPVEAPLDLLAQIVLSMALSEEWRLSELFAFLRTSYPYRDLTRRQFDLVIGMLEGKYADSRVPELKPRATVDRLAGTIATRHGLSMTVYLEGGTIPERGYFELRLADGGAKLGELDEEFVWERKIGDTFSLGAQVWQIVEITQSAVLVTPARRPQQVIPFWRAEELDRDCFYSDRIARFLEGCEAQLASGELAGDFAERHFLDRPAARALEAFLTRQRESGGELPHRHHLLVELSHDPLARADARQIILHTLWGNRVNRPFTLALCAAWELKYGYRLQAIHNNDGIALLLPHELDDPRELLGLVTPENLESLLRGSLEGTGYFGGRFRENAGRALLLSRSNLKRRMPLWLNRLRSRKLMSAVQRYRDFPILLETWRSCLKDEFDLASLKRLLEEIEDGEIRVSRRQTTVPSPMARGLIWQQTGKYVYADDAPDAVGRSALGEELLKELVFSSHLRPRLPAELIRLFEAKLRRTAAGYAPEPGRELTDWVKERLLIPVEEWSALLAAVERDHGVGTGEIAARVADRVAYLQLPGAPLLLVAIEMLPEIACGLGRALPELDLLPLTDAAGVRAALERSFAGMLAGLPAAKGAGEKEQEEEEEDPAPVRLLTRVLSFYGPVELSRLQRTLALDAETLDLALHALTESGLVVEDLFTEEGHLPELCDAANLEALLRLLRRSRRPAFEALDLSQLPLFLASFQGLTNPGDALDDLPDTLEQLLGMPLPAGLWEEEVLPARLAPYFGAWLDSLMQTSELLWFGCGPGRLSFAFPEDLDLFLDREGAGRQTEADAGLTARLIPDSKGRYTLPAIALHAGLSSARMTAELWRLAWSGIIGNDSFVTVRKGILNRFVKSEAGQDRAGLRQPVSRWRRDRESTGSWYLLPRAEGAPDLLELEERNRDRVRVLLSRYGILFRELLLRELPLLQWGRLFRTLRLMEMSGELLSGNFFSGIPGLQFTSPDAFRLLERGLDEDAVYWLNAADPASLCGIGLEGVRGRLPARLCSTHLVYHGVRLVLVSRRYGKELDIRVEPDDPKLGEYLSFFRVLLGREFNPLKRVAPERVNGKPASGSEYKGALQAFGFQESYGGLELWRRY